MHMRHKPDDRLKKGLVALSMRKYEAVHKACMDMIHADTADSIPYFLLAKLSADHKNYPKALELFERAITLAPDVPRFQADYAKLLTQLNRQTEARAAATTAAGLNMEDADVADTIGVVLSRTGYHMEAVAAFDTAIALDASPSNFHYNRAASLQFAGQFSEAEAGYKAALKRDPKLYRAWSSLVSLSKQTATSNYLTNMLDLFHGDGLDADARLHLGHAIAKTYEDLCEHTLSLEWLGKAKYQKFAEIAYDFKQDLEIFDAVKAVPISPSPTEQPDDPAPIFIVGLPRTGTTLVDRIISSHSDVTSAGELNAFAGLVKAAARTPSNLVLDAQTMAASTRIDFRKIGGAFWNDTEVLRRGKPRMTDKMPLNFFYVGLIYRAFPNARIIALRRGAMDSCLSNYRQLFSTGFSYYNYSLDLGTTAQYYRAFDGLMSHWRQVIPSKSFLEIHYEDIVFDQENQTRKLLEFCGLDWQEACMRFYENTAPVSTASSVQVRQPLYSGSVGRWKKYGAGLDDLRRTLGHLA